MFERGMLPKEVSKALNINHSKIWNLYRGKEYQLYLDRQAINGDPAIYQRLHGKALRCLERILDDYQAPGDSQEPEPDPTPSDSTELNP